MLMLCCIYLLLLGPQYTLEVPSNMCDIVLSRGGYTPHTEGMGDCTLVASLAEGLGFLFLFDIVGWPRYNHHSTGVALKVHVLCGASTASESAFEYCNLGSVSTDGIIVLLVS